MTKQLTRIAIRGSARKSVPNARLLHKSDPEEAIQVSLFARRNPSPQPANLAKANAIASQPPSQRKYLSKPEFDDVYGAAPTDLTAIEKFAQDLGLKVIAARLSEGSEGRTAPIPGL